MATNKQIRHAYAAGALEKLAEHDIDPASFVQAAAQSQDQEMRKIASAIVELDSDIQYQQQQKTAGLLRGINHG